MDSFAEIRINGQILESWKNTYSEWYFKKEDYVHEDATGFVGYRATVATMRRRLQLAGYDNKSLEQDFYDTKAIWEHDLGESLEYYKRKGTKYSSIMVRDVSEYLMILKNTTFEEWKRKFARTVDENILELDDGLHPLEANIPGEPLISLMLSPLHDAIEHENYGFVGSLFPSIKMESFALLLMDVSNDNDICELDISNLIKTGWINGFDEYTDEHDSQTKFHSDFRYTLNELLVLSNSNDNVVLQRMVFSSVITAMEAYLSDTMKCHVLNRHAFKRRFVESYSTFINKKIQSSTIFSFMDSLDREISEEIDKISFHNIQVVTGLYKNVLLCSFPEDKIAQLSKSVETRHHIVHRNGRTTDGSIIVITDTDVIDLIELVGDVVENIDKQILDGLPNTSSEQS